MQFGEAVRIATASLWAHKMRTVLTLLGVVIGVMSVIAVVSLLNGLNRYVAEKIFNLGADVFIISKVTPVITNVVITATSGTIHRSVAASLSVTN